ncbi:hypothetical protein EDB80DRAFT_314020 [Ilyonectria destructans]|nr:hypothetical protein EDB80DRAFT_314020 [Ilyonectria destructans]
MSQDQPPPDRGESPITTRGLGHFGVAQPYSVCYVAIVLMQLLGCAAGSNTGGIVGFAIGVFDHVLISDPSGPPPFLERGFNPSGYRCIRGLSISGVLCRHTRSQSNRYSL